MPDLIDLPSRAPARQRSSRLLILLASLFALAILGRITLSYWVDLLWFASLGYGAVFWRTLGFEALIFGFTTSVTFLLLYGAFTVMRHSHEADLPSAHALVIAASPSASR